MKVLAIAFCAVGALAMVGCHDDHSTPAATGGDAKVEAAMSKLAPEDRAVAEQQRVCPVTGEPLGSMGTPIKVVVNDKPVFICCKSCEKNVKDNADEMLKKVEALKAETASRPK